MSFYRNTSVSRSEKHRNVFISFSEEKNQETIAMGYPQALQLAIRLLNELKISGYSRKLKECDVSKKEVSSDGNLLNDFFTKALENPCENIREQAVLLLGGEISSLIMNKLQKILFSDPSCLVRKAVVQVLGNRKIEAVLHNQLIGILKNPSEEEELRASIARALGKMGNLVDVPILLSLLKDSSLLVRLHVCNALGKIQDLSCAKDLGKLALTDPEPHVRRAAIKALGQIGGAESRKIFLQAKKDKHAHVRTAAERALEKLL